MLEIETESLMSRCLKEPSTNNEIYPHIYGPINRDAIVRRRTEDLNSTINAGRLIPCRSALSHPDNRYAEF